MKKLSIIGTGFISKGLVDLVLSKDEFVLSKVLTRSNIRDREDFKQDYLTNSLDEVIESSDIIVECSGDVLYATENINEIMKHKIPIVTMNTEFHVTVGSYFVNKGFITEGEGDQPGSLAALNEEAVEMGFEPCVYGNIKGFLNNNPLKKDMKYWAKRSNLSLEMVTSFTDGTKVQMEQAFVANGLGATILSRGLTGINSTNIIDSANQLAAKADKINNKISDYIVSKDGPPGVFLTAKHNQEQQKALEYYKLGKGPYYTLIKPYHLPHLELYKTIKRVAKGGTVLLNNSNNPTISVAAIAKHDLKVGTSIKQAIGSFELRGEAVKIKDYPEHMPIGLIKDAILKRDIEEGEIITINDIKVPDNLAVLIYEKILKKALK